MSRKHRHEHECCYDEKYYCKKEDNCCCSFPALVILILILLQFNRGGHGFLGKGAVEGFGGFGGFDGFFGTGDNSILFIIALFFLACCNPCKRY